ncbi:MAG: DegV family protein [Chloroflexi bacterium]|jgi:DegV family protein with EDD domain|nr:DegV family protein [Anaerolineaceae bacterium]NLI44370.1 DegV family protein [Chloroflexota bacterium]HOE34407.1 DegV family protein [Anaerolineaceae bacterium]HOT25416.1 DegV family protein [Anaerolineaceae bacterium]HQH57402.1 DegV family protein [Anaerolineaceae bacterium]
MGKIIITTDSSAYLPQEYAERYNISVIPLTLNWDGKTYRDGIDIGATEFYTRLSKSQTLPTTSQVTVQQYLDFFKPLLEAGHQVLHTGISTGISASMNSALIAKEELGNPQGLEIVDSKLVSTALSFLVLALARASEEGASMKDLLELVPVVYPKIGVYFTVDTLEYLHKGGRINTAKRFLGTALNIKPLLEIRDGKIEAVESVISRKKAITRMLELVEKRVGDSTPVRIGPFHALCEEECLALEARAVEILHPIEVIRSEVSPVVGAHVGPGTLSLAWMAG